MDALRRLVPRGLKLQSPIPAADQDPVHPMVCCVADQCDRQVFGDAMVSAKTRPRPQTEHLTDETDRRNAVIHVCSCDWFTGTASRCMNSSGDITKCVAPSRHAVFSLSTTCPAALVCTRSLASAERVMYRHSSVHCRGRCGRSARRACSDDA